ncbi:hypothetical protein ACRAWB_01845 [Leifsonia poae]|uniref:hypothetical protein n=1 Tax=Leifsonia poae TaxID=110933 RepID=UPI003D6872F5
MTSATSSMTTAPTTTTGIRHSEPEEFARTDEVAFQTLYRSRSVNSVADTAHFMQCSTDTIYELVARKEIETFRAGKRILILTRPLLRSLGED